MSVSPYQRLFAWLLNRIGPVHDRAVSRHKDRLLSTLRGTVLEIGPGTGVNLRRYPDSTRIVAAEPNPFMVPYYRQEARARGAPAILVRALGESLPFGDDVFDAVVSTVVLCSVDRVDDVLREVVRVLRPGGRFVYVEHVAAPPGSRLRRVQGWIRPLWRRLGDGCRPDRETGRMLRAAGFARLRHECFRADLPLPVVRPHIAGVATK